MLALALYYSSLPSAQQLNIRSSIDSSTSALSLLDSKASDCLSALESGSNSQPLCDDFIAAIDGKLMADYLEQCQLLKNWRDDFIIQTIEAEADTDSANNEEMLRRLVAIEYSCGENAVLARTEFVEVAFNRLRNNTDNSSVATGISAAISRQLAQSRFEALEIRERRRLQEAMQRQQSQSQRDTDRQFDDLENELIRQQIRSSNWNN